MPPNSFITRYHRYSALVKAPKPAMDDFMDTLVDILRKSTSMTMDYLWQLAIISRYCDVCAFFAHVSDSSRD